VPEVKRLLALLVAVGGIGLLVSRLRRRRDLAEAPAEPDPRAADLRRKLDATRAHGAGGERTAAPTDPPNEPFDLTEARRRVHEQGRAAADEMRQAGADPATPA
jgi:hypothetical protein